jgi:hypothetical protein
MRKSALFAVLFFFLASPSALLAFEPDTSVLRSNNELCSSTPGGGCVITNLYIVGGVVLHLQLPISTTGSLIASPCELCGPAQAVLVTPFLRDVH